MKIIRRSQFIQRKFLLAISVFFAALSGAVDAAPVHIAVQTPMGTQEYGAGISVGKGMNCFVVAPLHVVEIAQTITITDRRGNTALATHFQAPKGVDAILLRVEENHRLDCPEDWDDGIAAENAMYDAEFLVSKKVKAGGIDQRRFFAGSVTSTTITVQPYRSGKADRLIEGDSGSSLYVKNMPLGMIVSVDTSNGEGEAIKQSQLHALFSNFMLEPSTKVALINPVYQGYRENRYATAAVSDFIATRTPLATLQMNPAVAQTNLQNERRGLAPQYPGNADYVIHSSIIANQSRRVANPKYDARKSKTSNFGKKLLNRATAKDFRYYSVSNVDVEITVVDLETNQRTMHMQRSEYRTPLTDDVNERDVISNAPVRGTLDALYVAMTKIGVTVADEARQQPQLQLPSEPELKKDDDILSSILGISSKD